MDPLQAAVHFSQLLLITAPAPRRHRLIFNHFRAPFNTTTICLHQVVFKILAITRRHQVSSETVAASYRHRVPSIVAATMHSHHDQVAATRSHLVSPHAASVIHPQQISSTIAPIHHRYPVTCIVAAATYRQRVSFSTATSSLQRRRLPCRVCPMRACMLPILMRLLSFFQS